VQLWDPATGTGTGIVFDHHDAAGLQWAIEAALAVYRDRAAWQTLIDNGMAKDFSWDVQGKLYEELYRRLSQNG
jgi:starch synthase